MDTTVFEVHYHLVPVTSAPPATFVYHSTPAGSWQTGSEQKALAAPKMDSASSPLPSSTAVADSSNPLLSSLSAAPVSQALITQVNAAALSNPTLANLLQMAAAGRASPDQLKTLGLLIQSLANSPAMDLDVTPAPSQTTPSRSDAQPGSGPIAPTMTPQYQLQVPVQDFDIVLEFREAPSDRWLFPRGPATCEFTSTSGDSGAIGDITLSTIVPFAPVAPAPIAPGVENSSTSDNATRQVVTFQFRMASSFVWDSISRWVGPKIDENQKILNDLASSERKFLAHRLPEGSQLTQIQNAAAPNFSMKLIKPATDSTKPKRRSTSRKTAQDGDASGSQPMKRRRQTQPKTQIMPPKIACFTCGQTDVPLIMGGRYCRPCVEAGRGREVPQVGGISFAYKLPVPGDAQSSTAATVNPSPSTLQALPPKKSSIPAEDNIVSHSEQK
ncbi:hypothetical protein HYDPIDRAFT_166593 [Hydnomerulius pinastri MD-312]|nr:hypothetical protein HYDPIDRAFT_166593 [Hydnomerulius pinastri MD-312]